ncbi:MAG: sensor histidine kinase, partial [Planctomycetota bacterium]|nr:sensor histidine kinase [Planctomycetota bacterium]
MVLAAMGWISLTVLRLDRAEVKASRQAVAEESIRLALWRMDSALGPLIAQESQRPYFNYRAFYSAERAYTRMFNEIQPEEVLLPSPLLTFASPSILLHFQIGPDGRITSPQAATGAMRRLAETAYTTPSAIDDSSRQMEKLNGLISADTLFAALPDVTDHSIKLARRMDGALPAPATPDQTASLSARQSQTYRSGVEQQARMGQQRLNMDNYFNPNAAQTTADVSLGAMKPLWMEQALLLARRVSVNDQSYV